MPLPALTYAKDPDVFYHSPLSARCRTHRTEPGYCSNTRRNPGRPASFAAPAQANSAERAKAHTTISSLSSAQQKAGFNRFVITYTDSALNAGGINWASPAGTQVATWNDALYQGLTSEVKSVDDLFKIKTNYVRTTAQKATVVTLSSKLTAEQAEKYMATLSSNPSVASVEPDLLRRSTARARGAATSRSLR